MSVAVLVVGSSAREARAQSSAADMESARDLYKVGKAMRDRGDLPGALEKLRAAHALAHTPITGVELGRTYQMLGRLVEAREAWLEVGRMPTVRNESANARQARGEASQFEAAVLPRIPTLLVHVSGAPSGASPILTIDEVTIPAAAATEARRVDPGKHVIAVHVDGGEASRVELELREGEQREVTLAVLPPAAIATPVPAPSATASTPPAAVASRASEAGHGGPGVVGWTGFAIGGAGLLVGAATGVLAFSKKGTVDGECPDRQCPASAQPDINASKAFGNVSNVAFIVAGAGAAVGALTLLFGHESRPAAAASIEPWVGPGSAGVRGSF